MGGIVRRLVKVLAKVLSFPAKGEDENTLDTNDTNSRREEINDIIIAVYQGNRHVNGGGGSISP